MGGPWGVVCESGHRQVVAQELREQVRAAGGGAVSNPFPESLRADLLSPLPFGAPPARAVPPLSPTPDFPDSPAAAEDGRCDE